jgi:hypothetical protein
MYSMYLHGLQAVVDENKSHFPEFVKRWFFHKKINALLINWLIYAHHRLRCETFDLTANYQLVTNEKHTTDLWLKKSCIFSQFPNYVNNWKSNLFEEDSRLKGLSDELKTY